MLAMTVAGCRPTVDPVPVSSTPPVATATGEPSESVTASASTPSVPTQVPASTVAPSPTATPTPVVGIDLPVGTGTVTLDGLVGTASGDCVVSGARAGPGFPGPGAVVAAGVVVSFPGDAAPASIRIVGSDPVLLRVDGRGPDGRAAWEASDVQVDLTPGSAVGFAVASATVQAAPADLLPSLPVAPLTPTPGPTASPGGSPATPEPQRTRPDPAPGSVVSPLAPIDVELSIVCRVTTDVVD